MKEKILLNIVTAIVGLFLAVGTASASTYSIHQFSPFAGFTGFNNAEESLNGAPFTPATVTNDCLNFGNSRCDLLQGAADFFEWTVTLPFLVSLGGGNIISAEFVVDRFDSNFNTATLSTDGVVLGTITEPVPDGAGGIGFSGLPLTDFSVLEDGLVTLRVSNPTGGDGDFGVRKFIFAVEFIELAVDKEITSGPDVDEDGEIDVVVDVGQTVTTEYDFDITYTNPGGPDVLIEDTVPAEWIVEAIEGDVTGLPLGCGESASFSNSFGTVDVFKGGKVGKKCQGSTHIEWTPDPNGGKINVVATTRQSPGKKNVKFAPTSCGGLFLNDGAAAFEIDPATGEPFVDQDGNRLPPILESNQLCLAAVEDVNGDGVIDRTGNGDEDGDGLTDLQEACEIGTDPCIADTDGDGVNDNLDQCPLQGLEVTGSVDANGCPI